jgi:hypothetical protein
LWGFEHRLSPSYNRFRLLQPWLGVLFSRQPGERAHDLQTAACLDLGPHQLPPLVAILRVCILSA